jgi:photosystem II stability/assembly factor-like uncharacterized protein
MKIKIYKILGVALTVAMLVSLLVGFSAVPAAAKTYDENEWEKFETPKEGSAGDFILYYGSNVHVIALTIDGTLYAGVGVDTDDPQDQVSDEFELYVSNDDGASWDILDEYDATKPFVDIATSPVDEEIFYIATTDTVYKTTDGGEEFTAMSDDPWADETPTSIDVTYYNDAHIVCIGTDGAPGDVYVFDEGETFGGWVARGATDPLSTDDVLDAAFSPFFEDDRQITAVVTDGSDVWATTSVEGGAFGGNVGDSDTFGYDITTPIAGDGIDNATGARIAFPDDYDADPDSGDYVQFVSVSAPTETGSKDAGVFMIEGVDKTDGNSIVTTLERGFDAYSIHVSGDASDANIIYGLETNAADEACVRFSTDGGEEFDPAYKEPSGASACQILVTEDMAYAGTTGVNSAFSVSTDDGDTWSQPGLVDAKIGSFVNWEHLGPDTFWITNTGEFATEPPGVVSIWKTSDMGDSWYRVISSGVTVFRSTSKVYEFTGVDDSKTGDDILWIEDGGTPAFIWKTDDGGDTWNQLKATVVGTDPLTKDKTIGKWIVFDESEIKFFDGNTLYQTTNGGTSWSKVADVDDYTGNTIGGFKLDKATGMYLIWAGNAGTDQILISDDEGTTWEEANPEGSLNGAIGNFDPDFGVPGAAGYNTIYAANADGVWRYVIDESSDWEELTYGLPTTMEVGKVIELFPMPTIPPGSGAPDPDGTMYAYQAEDTGGPPPPDQSPGMLRTVYPTDRDEEAGTNEFEVEWELIKTGGGGNAWRPGAPIVSPAGLSMFMGDQTAGSVAIYMYTDTLNKPGKLSAPGDGTTSGREGSAMLTWEEMSEADKYEVQWAEDSEFEVEKVSK